MNDQKRSYQIPVEVGQHDKLKVEEIGEGKIILDKQVELAAPWHRPISEIRIKANFQSRNNILENLPFLHLACQQQCSQTHQVQLRLLRTRKFIVLVVANLNIMPVHEKVNNPEREVEGGRRQIQLGCHLCRFQLLSQPNANLSLFLTSVLHSTK